MNIRKRILESLKEVEIYQYYFGKFYPNKICMSNEKVCFSINLMTMTSFYIFEENDQLRWCDEGTQERGDIFQLLQKCYRLNSYETMVMIDLDFDLKLILNNRKFGKYYFIELTDKTNYYDGLGAKTIAYDYLEEKINKVVKPTVYYAPLPYNERLYTCFQSYNIDKTILDKYEIFPIDFCEIKTFRQHYVITSSPKHPLFAYRYSNSIKVVTPKIQGQINRIIQGGRIGSKYIFGLKQLAEKVDKLLLVGCEIDVMVLSTLGYAAVCICGYNSELTKGLFEHLERRAERIIYVFSKANRIERERAIFLKEQFGIASIHLQNK